MIVPWLVGGNNFDQLRVIEVIGEVPAGEIDDETARARYRRLGRTERRGDGLPGVQHAPVGRELGKIETGDDAVGVGERLARLGRIFRREGGDDIVVGLVPGRQFDEFDAAFAPAPPRLDPIGSGASHRRGRDPDNGRSRGRAATGQTRAGLCRERQTPPASQGCASGRQIHSPVPEWIKQPIRIMQFRTKVIVEAVIVLADEKHRGQWGEAELDIRLARKKLAETSIAVSTPG